MRGKWAACAAILSLLPQFCAAQQVEPGRAAKVSLVDHAPLPQGHLALAPEHPEVPPTSGGMTLADAEQTALGANPSLAQAAARVDAVRGRYVQVGLYPNPTAGYIASEIGNEGRAGQQGGFVSQEIVTAGKLRLNREVVCWEIQQAEWAYESQKFRVLTDVRRFFYEVLVAQRSVELSAQLVRIGEQGIRSTEELLKAKEVARNDVLQAKIEADTARMFHERARNRHLAAWRNLAAVIGNSDMPPRLLVGDVQDGLDPITWEDSL
jgi:outer membrane protein, heavy metal efflux system